MLRKSLLVLCVVSSLVALAANADVCTQNIPTNDTIELTAIAGEATYSLANPIKGLTATDIKAAWFTDQQLMSGGSASTKTETKPFPFTIGFCRPDPGDTTKPQTVYFTGTDDLSALAGADAQAIVIRFVPTEPGTISRFLRFTWKVPDTSAGAAAGATKADKPKTVKVVATAGIPDYAGDSRYKLWAYTGYTFMRSQNDFQDGYAELLARFETRWVDERIAVKHFKPQEYKRIVSSGHRCATWPPEGAPPEAYDKCASPLFSIARIYGNIGLTGTTLVATDAANSTKIGGTKSAFGGDFGVGIGKTRLVSCLKPATDTCAFSWLPVARLGIISIPGDSNATPAIQSRSAFNYSVNFRIENEPNFSDDGSKGGNFEGAYFELGVGESEQFSRKKFPRLRFDGLLPINNGNDLFRFAGRLQIDAPRPFVTKKKDPTDNLANEIRISILLNMDLLELGKRISGKK
jgi:hypothetical protein